MSEWNNRITNVIIQISENIRQVKIIILDNFYEFIINYNSVLILCLLVVFIGICIWNKFNTKGNTVFTKFKIINLVSHIALACIFGYLFKNANFVKLNELLSMYWSIGFLLYSSFIILFLKELLIYIKSSNRITQNFSKLYYVLGLTYIFTAISINQLVIENNLLLILLFILGWSFLQFLSQEFKSDYDDLVDEESDVEINSFNQLLPTRQQEYKRILALLRENNYNEPFALVLNGNWGEGKTSLINVFSKKILEEGNFKILIQPMILDTPEKLMEYFFNQLENILNSNGIFTGKGSPFKKYINILFQTINTLNLKQIIKLDGLLDSMDDDELLDYRSTKDRLEKDIQKLLNSINLNNNTDVLGVAGIKKKVFIIIDDFDRVEEDTFKNTLIFIKELVNFNGINVIFLMDEQRIDEHKKINRDYLDKFVNRKFQLSKLSYQEIFNYFIKNLEVEKLVNGWSSKVGNKIKENIVYYINEITSDFEKKVEEIQKGIDELSKNKSTDKINQSGNEEPIAHLEDKLRKEKKEFEVVLYKFKDGISNARKVKKIIRELKEILISCDLVCSKNQNFNENLSRIDRIEELIVRIAIYKILFGEQVDKLIQQNDFYSVMNDIKYLQQKDYLLSSLFIKFINGNITEEQGLKMDIINDFCNALILNHPLDKLLENKKTVSENILKRLDDQTTNLEITSMKEIKEYLGIILFNTYGVKSHIINARRAKIINHIIALYEKKILTLKNLFELLGEPQRNPLLDSELYLAKLNEIINRNASFQNSRDKTVSLTYLQGISMNIFLGYRSDIIMIMRLLKLDDPSYRYDSFSADLGDIYSFEEMEKAIKRIFKIEGNSVSELTFFKQWIISSLQTILNDNKDNKYIIESVKHYKNNIDKFIKIYSIKEALQEKLIDSKIDPVNKFNEKLTINSIKELILDIEEFYEFIGINKNTLTSQYLRYFSSLLMHLEKYTRNYEFDSEIINKVEELYNFLPVDEYDKNSEEKRTWLWCTVKLGEIKENLKILQLKEEIEEAVEEDGSIVDDD